MAHENFSEILCPRIRVKEVAHILGCSVSTVWAWARAGLIPQPTRVGSRFSFWLREEILKIASGKDTGPMPGGRETTMKDA